MSVTMANAQPIEFGRTDYFESYDFESMSDSSFNRTDTSVINSDFKVIIESLKRTEDYKYLRQYKNRKETLLRQNEKALVRFQRKMYNLNFDFGSRSNEYRYFRNQINDINRILSKNKFDPDNPVLNSIGIYNYYNHRITKDDVIARLVKLSEEQKNRKEQIKKDSISISDSKKTWRLLIQNKQNIESDLDECISAIDAAIAPEYKNQSFKRQISIAFSILIGVLIIIFFLIVYKRSDNSISMILLSDGGLQFVTIFVLIIAVILFGVLDILKSNELSAILSGIAGYILGKSGKLPSANQIQSIPQNNTPPK